MTAFESAGAAPAAQFDRFARFYDADYREYDTSGDSTEKVIKSLPSGAVLKVNIIALNGSLEASSGPEAQISVP